MGLARHSDDRLSMRESDFVEIVLRNPVNAEILARLHREFVGFCEPYTEDFLVAFDQAPAS